MKLVEVTPDSNCQSLCSIHKATAKTTVIITIIVVINKETIPALLQCQKHKKRIKRENARGTRETIQGILLRTRDSHS